MVLNRSKRVKLNKCICERRLGKRGVWEKVVIEALVIPAVMGEMDRFGSVQASLFGWLALKTAVKLDLHSTVPHVFLHFQFNTATEITQFNTLAPAELVFERNDSEREQKRERTILGLLVIPSDRTAPYLIITNRLGRWSLLTRTSMSREEVDRETERHTVDWTWANLDDWKMSVW